MTLFNEIGLSQSFLDRLNEMGFNEMTPIQEKSIPVAMEGRDVLGSAQTGTGKTGAYGIPLVSKLIENSRGTALVLLPTRELAVQVAQALKAFIGKERIRTAILIGGEPMPPQMKQLGARPRLIIGTPGRINDHLERGSLKLHDTRFLVLDEVDRMLDMGFGIQLDAIAKYLTNERQTLMFSATLPNNIKALSAKYLNNPERISVGETNETAKNIKQSHVKLTEGEKYVQLLDELEHREGSVIIFSKTKHGADRMAEKLRKKGHKAEAIHGDLRQNKRNYVIRGFRDKRYRILVATDVAARGLDIPHIEHVINYDLPQNPEDYIHRIGRTARAGAQGEAVAFLTPGESHKWRAIQRLLNPHAKIDEEPRPRKSKGKSSGATRKGKPGGRFGDKPRRDRDEGGSSRFGKKPFGDKRRRRDDENNDEGGGRRKRSGEGGERRDERKRDEGKKKTGFFGRKRRDDDNQDGGERRKREGEGGFGRRRRNDDDKRSGDKRKREGGERRRDDAAPTGFGKRKRPSNDDRRGGGKPTAGNKPSKGWRSKRAG